MESKESLGEILVRSGVIDADQLEKALAFQSNLPVPRARLGSIIVDLAFASESGVASALAERYGVPFSDLDHEPPSRAVLAVVPRRLAQRGMLVPLDFDGDDGIVLAMADPTDVVAIDDIRMVTHALRVSIVIAPASAIRRAHADWYRFDDDALSAAKPLPDDDTERLYESFGPSAASDDLEWVMRQADTAPIVRMVANIYHDAVRAGATDIHIEPDPRDVRVRFRVDGMLRDALVLPRRAHAGLVSRMKILSGMDIAERRRPQDGRSSLTFEGRAYDLRMSTIGTPDGEKVAIRILPQGEDQVRLGDIGMEPEDLALLERHLDRPHGMIVFTGPPGSGKTTAMYASLRRIHGPERSLITIEDPIESYVPYATQVQVDERSGIGFAQVLRAVLRQDPNVVLVGEIRDAETAHTAAQAAMTGILMLTTLHTVDAPSAVARLIDLGLEPFLVASSLSAVVAQRLVRKICDRCREPGRPGDVALRSLGMKLDDVAGADTAVGAGCQACAHTGFRGRIGLFEVLSLTPGMRDLMVTRASVNELGMFARGEGLRTLRERGIQKALAGVTTFEEIARVTFPDRERVVCHACGRDLQPDFAVCPYCTAHVRPHIATG